MPLRGRVRQTGCRVQEDQSGYHCGQGEGFEKRKLPKAALPKSEIQMHVKLPEITLTYFENRITLWPMKITTAQNGLKT